MRRTVVLLVLAAVTALSLRRRTAARQAERDLWAEAGVAPDLR